MFDRTETVTEVSRQRYSKSMEGNLLDDDNYFSRNLVYKIPGFQVHNFGIKDYTTTLLHPGDPPFIPVLPSREYLL